ncbi:hypothetical protein WICMUC_001578 [Wickerhamomyces mucosus]|uniref:UDP-N-acetylglucosamine--dolichyl-phosphate N-acetylglucosaminephosphotransferase n=1 Tax=Wickerhamomyces mucosus TaxID=1378264 RepID=A0A9P8PVH0_9ASCO|nr:hypothetical protein WICMUC_001578 [Wickerhamomyces mucosus]
MINGALLVLAIVIIYTATGFYRALQASIGFSIVGYIGTDILIPKLIPLFIKKNFIGKDLSKPSNPIIPETMGAVPAVVYLFIMFFFIPFLFYKYLVIGTAGGGNRDAGITLLEEDINVEMFPHDKLASYLSAILTLESTILLGIADDLFDIKWRHKFFLPAIAAIPLLIVYYVDFGITHVLVPTKFLQNYFGTTLIELGSLYYVYMGSVAIFAPNSINILAGVNGLETGQSIVIGILLLINDACYFISAQHNSPAIESHLFSSVLVLPFLGVAFALLKYNWYPSRVFVGDVFCYFSGIIFAVVGILGHFSKTLLIFLIPQIFNFVYSVPQLFGIIPCPRHRLPRYNKENDLMYPSLAKIEKPLNKSIENVLKFLAKLKLLYIIEKEGKIVELNNLTLINLTLVWFGPMREDKLCTTILIVQFLIGLFALILRHTLGLWLFGYDNLWVPN